MRIVAALSGGVDSAVAAARLVAEGHDVVGVHYRTGVHSEDACAPVRTRSCCGADDARDARAVAARLGIPCYAIDVSEAFRRDVIAPFVAGYASGLTPNPCVACNDRVKFGRLAELARGYGAEAVATGHYARVERDARGRPRLFRGTDPRKDQSYVLAGLSREQLAFARFPLGASRKEDVRAEARALGLPVADKPDSMEICFVPDGDHRSLLAREAPSLAREGDVLDERGNVVGRHRGAAGYTLGQRRGVGVATGSAAYVTSVDVARNAVTLGPREACLRRTVEVSALNWLDADPEERPPGATFRVSARVRHAGPPADATLVVLPGERAEARFDEPVFAPAPGQAFAAYRGDTVLLGGTILGSRP